MFSRPGVDSGPILGIAGMKPWAVQRCRMNPEYGDAGYLGYDIASSKNGSPASKFEIGYGMILSYWPMAHEIFRCRDASASVLNFVSK